MAAFQPQLVMTILTLVSFLAVSGLSVWQPDMSAVSQGPAEEDCMSCELFFRKLDRTEESGKLSHVIRVQERGEPKSGTGFMFDWATAALLHTCAYLKRLFGKESCMMDFSPGLEDDDGMLLPRLFSRRMIFEPALGAGDARCPCLTIERVTILLSSVDKHALPVNSDSCAFSHNHGIQTTIGNKSKRKPSACTFADGTTANDNGDLWRCMHEANCDINDDWLQMVVYRDPRPAVVSAFFHLNAHTHHETGNLEQFVVEELPILCQWLALRHILFSGLLSHQSMEFWYNDALADPLEWFYHFLDSVGLQLPHYVVKGVAVVAEADNLGFPHKKIDLHPGETTRNETGGRKFADEVSPEVLKTADAILRLWLPSVLLERLGVQPE